MRSEQPMDVVDFAYQIIAMQNKIERLEGEVAHYKHLHEMEREALDSSFQNTRNMIGTVLEAVIDPDSGLNKGLRARSKLDARGEKY